MNDWIEWNGGQRPIAYGLMVEVKHRGGEIYQDYAGIQGSYCQYWDHVGFSGDIVAYRLLETTECKSKYADLLNVEGYEMLGDVLSRAFDQAASGKGAERHAQGELFENQPMQVIADMVGIGFPLGQAIKKIQESQRLPLDGAVRELLGAINYLAGAIIKLERDHAESTT